MALVDDYQPIAGRARHWRLRFMSCNGVAQSSVLLARMRNFQLIATNTRATPEEMEEYWAHAVHGRRTKVPIKGGTCMDIETIRDILTKSIRKAARQ